MEAQMSRNREILISFQNSSEKNCECVTTPAVLPLHMVKGRICKIHLRRIKNVTRGIERFNSQRSAIFHVPREKRTDQEKQSQQKEKMFAFEHVAGITLW